MLRRPFSRWPETVEALPSSVQVLPARSPADRHIPGARPSGRLRPGGKFQISYWSGRRRGFPPELSGKCRAGICLSAGFSPAEPEAGRQLPQSQGHLEMGARQHSSAARYYAPKHMESEAECRQRLNRRSSRAEDTRTPSSCTLSSSRPATRPPAPASGSLESKLFKFKKWKAATVRSHLVRFIRSRWKLHAGD